VVAKTLSSDRSYAAIYRGPAARGSAVHDVLDKARELAADLIVLTRSTHSWWAEALGASVSAEIAKRADRDVLVVHGESSNRFGMPSEPRSDTFDECVSESDVTRYRAFLPLVLLFMQAMGYAGAWMVGAFGLALSSLLVYALRKARTE
jgi:hypothetical protein